MGEPTPVDQALPDEFMATPVKPRKTRKRKAASGEPAAKREVGTWIARSPDGVLSTWTSELQALRTACQPEGWTYVEYGTPVSEAQKIATEGKPGAGVWVAINHDGEWAPFARELGALRFAVPDGAVMFLRNGDRIPA
jgi:hypothetical protein